MELKYKFVKAKNELDFIHKSHQLIPHFIILKWSSDRSEKVRKPHIDFEILVSVSHAHDLKQTVREPEKQVNLSIYWIRLKYIGLNCHYVKPKNCYNFKT